MIDLNKIKEKRASLKSKFGNGQKSNLVWKPNPGKTEVRIIPYKFCPENPFIELKFHYNMNNKTYLSPSSFGRPDPIVEFSNKLKRSGDKNQWQLGRRLEPKMRTYVPIIVRGQENEGVKFWGFGKQVYEELLAIMDDSDYGDITDLKEGRDIVIEFKTAEELGKNYPETHIRAKPNTKPAVDLNNKELVAKLADQTDILTLFPELSYEELQQVMDAWFHPENAANAEDNDPNIKAAAEILGMSLTDDANDKKAVGNKDTVLNKVDEVKQSKPVTPTTVAKGVDEVTDTFDELFNTKTK